jgi:hypothetical protein
VLLGPPHPSPGPCIGCPRGYPCARATALNDGLGIAWRIGALRHRLTRYGRRPLPPSADRRPYRFLASPCYLDASDARNLRGGRNLVPPHEGETSRPGTPITQLPRSSPVLPLRAAVPSGRSFVVREGLCPPRQKAGQPGLDWRPSIALPRGRTGPGPAMRRT